MTDLLTVKVRLPTERSDQGNYIIESMDTADEGKYYCRATNSLGRAEASVQVNMLGRLPRDLLLTFRWYCCRNDILSYDLYVSL